MDNVIRLERPIAATVLVRFGLLFAILLLTPLAARRGEYAEEENLVGAQVAPFLEPFLAGLWITGADNPIAQRA
jgi:hypothetical protein